MKDKEESFMDVLQECKRAENLIIECLEINNVSFSGGMAALLSCAVSLQTHHSTDYESFEKGVDIIFNSIKIPGRKYYEKDRN